MANEDYFQIPVHLDIRKDIDEVKEELVKRTRAKKSYTEVLMFLLAEHEKANYLADKINILQEELKDKLNKIKKFVESKTFQCSACGNKNGQMIRIDYDEIFKYIDNDTILIRKLKENR